MDYRVTYPHRINGQAFRVMFVTGGAWHLERKSDFAHFTTHAVELRPKMALTRVER